MLTLTRIHRLLPGFVSIYIHHLWREIAVHAKFMDKRRCAREVKYMKQLLYAFNMSSSQVNAGAKASVYVSRIWVPLPWSTHDRVI